MGFRTMKEDLFTIKALQSKGYDIQTILAMSDEEVDNLPISTRLIEGAKEYKARGGKTADEIAEELADMMMRDDSAPVSTEVLDAYVSVQEPEVTEVQIVQQVEVPEESSTKVQEVQEVEIIRTESAKDDIQIIKDALQKKDAKSFQPFIKHLKSEVPAAILDTVDSTLVAELIEARIAEVKAAQEKTK